MNYVLLREQKGETKMYCVSLKKQKGATKMKRGFTLIELLIVIAVIAILIGIALPRFRGMQEEGMIAQAKGELRTLQTAIESYYIHNGSYPTDSATWQSDANSLTDASPTIITAALTDPFSTDDEYQLVYSTSGDYYAVYSVGTTGSATVTAVSDAGVVTESASTCIYVSNGEKDTAP